MAKHRSIGLDIGTTAVRAAEVEFGPRGTDGQLIRYDEVPLPLNAIRDGEVEDQAAVAKAIKELWTKAGFTSKDVILGVGNQRVVVRALSLPWMPMGQLRKSLPYQVQDLLPMPTDEALLDFYPTDETHADGVRGVDGLLVAAARDTVSANVLAVESAGLRPVMVDLTAFALLRGMTRGRLGTGTSALVEIGARITTVVIARDGVPRFVRALPHGGQDATDAVARTLGVANVEAEQLKREIGVGLNVRPDLAEAATAVNDVMTTLVTSIRNTFSYYAGSPDGGTIDVVALTGGGASMAGLGQYLASASRLKVILGDPFEALRLAKTAGAAERFQGSGSRLALPIGLAYGTAAA